MNKRKLTCAVLAVLLSAQTSVFCSGNWFSNAAGYLKCGASDICKKIGLTALKDKAVKFYGDHPRSVKKGVIAGLFAAAGASVIAYKKLAKKAAQKAVVKIQENPSILKRIGKTVFSKGGIITGGLLATAALGALLYKKYCSINNDDDNDDAADADFETFSGKSPQFLDYLELKKSNREKRKQEERKIKTNLIELETLLKKKSRTPAEIVQATKDLKNALKAELMEEELDEVFPAMVTVFDRKAYRAQRRENKNFIKDQMNAMINNIQERSEEENKNKNLENPTIITNLGKKKPKQDKASLWKRTKEWFGSFSLMGKNKIEIVNDFEFEFEKKEEEEADEILRYYDKIN